MRILHILDHSIPLHSGYTFRTLAILREQRKRGWETFHLTSPKQLGCTVEEEDVDGWHFYRTLSRAGAPSSIPGMGELKLMRALKQRLHEVATRVKPDIIHAHSPVLNAWPALRVAAHLDIPVVYEIRAFWEDAAVDHGTATENGLRYRVTRFLETAATRRADHVTTICDGLKSDLLDRGLPSNTITVIPNAVDPDTFQYDAVPDAALREKWGLTGLTVLGFIGSFYAYEGLDLVIATLPQIIAEHPNARLLLVGGGPEEASLRRQAAALGVEERVVFVGRVPNSDVQKYYDLVDVLVYARHSMRLTELVTPLKPLEAMAQGRVFVASDVGGHRELITHGVNGFLFKAGDSAALAAAIRTVLGEPELRERVRGQARRYIEHERTWARSVARYEQVYGRLLTTKAAGQRCAC